METSKAFLNIPRQEAGYRPVEDRITDFSQVEQTLNSRDRKLQASRCMDCGVPFCHWACPLGNKDPEFQAALSQGKWEMAYRILSQTNDFPEFTGRICPALCEKSCVLKLSFDAPVTIRENEAAIAEAAFREGYIQPQQPVRNGKRVAVIGAGPAGFGAAGRPGRPEIWQSPRQTLSLPKTAERCKSRKPNSNARRSALHRSRRTHSPTSPSSGGATSGSRRSSTSSPDARAWPKSPELPAKPV